MIWLMQCAHSYHHFLTLTRFLLHVVGMSLTHIVERYNRVNGTHVSENPKIIQDILRKEWGSDALVMSDWYVSALSPSSFDA